MARSCNFTNHGSLHASLRPDKSAPEKTNSEAQKNACIETLFRGLLQLRNGEFRGMPAILCDSRRMLRVQRKIIVDTLAWSASAFRIRRRPASRSGSHRRPRPQFRRGPCRPDRFAIGAQHHIGARRAVFAAVQSEGIGLAPCRKDGGVHRLAEADAAEHAVAAMMRAARRPNPAGSKIRRAEPETASPELRDRSAANWSCGCARRIWPSKSRPAPAPPQMVS